MAEKEIAAFETTAGQVTELLKRLRVRDERMVTVVIEPDDWLRKARQASRRLVIDAGLGPSSPIRESATTILMSTPQTLPHQGTHQGGGFL